MTPLLNVVVMDPRNVRLSLNSVAPSVNVISCSETVWFSETLTSVIEDELLLLNVIRTREFAAKRCLAKLVPPSARGTSTTAFGLFTAKALAPPAGPAR